MNLNQSLFKTVSTRTECYNLHESIAGPLYYIIGLIIVIACTDLFAVFLCHHKALDL